MKLEKRYIPYGILGFLVITQVVVIGLRIDFWPFSYYPMFSKPHTTEHVGAYRMEALTHDKRALTVHLQGSKDVWQAYETLLSKNDIPALQLQMRRDMDYYIKQNPNVKITEIAEVRLVFVGLTESANHDKTINQKVLHSMPL